MIPDPLYINRPSLRPPRAVFTSDPAFAVKLFDTFPSKYPGSNTSYTHGSIRKCRDTGMLRVTTVTPFAAVYYYDASI